MSIQSVQIKMTRLGVCDHRSHQVMYSATAVVRMVGRGERREFPVGNVVGHRKFFTVAAVCGDFFVLRGPVNYEIYDENGTKTGTVAVAPVGVPVQARQEAFVCLRDRKLSLIDKAGAVVRQRDLTEEELAALKNGNEQER